MKHILLRVLFVTALVFSPAALQAQNYSIDWSVIGGGGGTSSGGAYSVTGTIGQPATGTMTGGSYAITGGFWSLLSTVQQPGAPTLFLLQSGSAAILYWSTSATGFNLESTANLAAPASWAPVSPSPSAIGGFNYVTNTIAPGLQFYRLRHP